MPEPPPVSGISELVLEVSDLEAARRFYRDLLGFEETFYGEGRDDRCWYLIGSSARLGLWTPQVGLAGGRGGVHVHFAFHLERKELDPLLDRLRSAGVEIEGPIQLGADLAIYVTDPEKGFHTGISGQALYVTDPDGNVVEFWTQDMAEYAAGARRHMGTPPR